MLKLIWIRTTLTLSLVSAFCVLTLPAMASSAPEDFQVIVNPNNPILEIKSEALSALFLRKQKAFKDGHEAEPVEISAKDPLYGVFAETVHNKSATQLRSWWGRQIFMGKAAPPRKFSSPEELLEYVRNHREAIAYLPVQTPLEGVKTLKVNYSK